MEDILNCLFSILFIVKVDNNYYDFCLFISYLYVTASVLAVRSLAFGSVLPYWWQATAKVGWQGQLYVIKESKCLYTFLTKYLYFLVY